MLDSKQVKILKSLYSKGASYKFIADKIGATIKQVDNYIYKHGLSNGRGLGARGGIKSDVMSMAPVSRLRKDDIVWMSNNFCEKHGEPYLFHYDCFLRESPGAAKIGHFDIETSDLKASYGILLTYSILDNDTGEILCGSITKEDLDGTAKPDSRVVEECVKDMNKFDVLVGYYSTKFDIPFIRTRAAILDIPFPSYGHIKHIDIYYVVRNKIKLHNGKLSTACECLLGSTEKTVIDPDHWIKAMQGNKEGLDYILDHNKRDVRDLKRLYDRLIDYRYPCTRSI